MSNAQLFATPLEVTLSGRTYKCSRINQIIKSILQNYLERRAIAKMNLHQRAFGKNFAAAMEVLVRDICVGAFSWGEVAFRKIFDEEASLYLVFLCLNHEDTSLIWEVLKIEFDKAENQTELANLIKLLYADVFPDEDLKKNMSESSGSSNLPA